jgi:hypothetical protein
LAIDDLAAGAGSAAKADATAATAANIVNITVFLVIKKLLLEIVSNSRLFF